MLKVLKNLKQSWLSVVVIVLLLCVQAAADLELPNYTSKIVNKGIQSGGIEDAVPDVISYNDMKAILFFTDNDEKILENYTSENDEKYVVKDLKKDEREELSELLIKPIIISQTIQNETLQAMPQEQVDQMLIEVTKQVDEMQDSIKEQAAVGYVKLIYQNAGLDTDEIQMGYIFATGLKMLGLALISMSSAVIIMFL